MNRSSRSPVSLLPIFRSEAQFRLLGELFVGPASEYSIGELALRVGVSHATVSREVGRLEVAGLLETRERGRMRLVHPRRDTPVFEPLRELLAKSYGVPAVLLEEFGELDARVFIFGSWAARWAGEPGGFPNDVDVLVLGEADVAAAWEAASRASRRLEVEVNVVVRDPDQWAGDTTAFAADIADGPHLEVTGVEDARAGTGMPRPGTFA